MLIMYKKIQKRIYLWSQTLVFTCGHLQNIYLLFAVLSMSLKLPVNKGTLGFRTALQKRAAVLNPIYHLIQQTSLAICLICSDR